MTAIELGRYAVAAGLAVVLALIAVSDARDRRIPNAGVLALLVLFVTWTVVNRGVGLVSGIEAFGISLAVTGVLFAFKVIGAGDSKLFTVAALYAGMTWLPLMALVTVLIGGAIALVILISRPIRGLVMLQMRGQGDWGRGVPYGVPIAIACAGVVWAPLLGLLPRG